MLTNSVPPNLLYLFFTNSYAFQSVSKLDDTAFCFKYVFCLFMIIAIKFLVNYGIRLPDTLRLFRGACLSVIVRNALFQIVHDLFRGALNREDSLSH